MTKWEYAYMDGQGYVTVLMADGSDEGYREESRGRKDSDFARRMRMLAKMGAAGWELFYVGDQGYPANIRLASSFAWWFKRPVSS